jgi:AcrR family transcriptional regulator
MREGARPPRIAAFQHSRMLAAAAQAACDRGAANLTVADVVDRAGVSRRTFYEAFGDIQDCLRALLRQTLVDAGERVLPAYENARGGWRWRVRAGLVELLLYFDEQPDVARLLVVEWLAAGAEAAAQRQRLLLRLAAVVQAGAPADEDAEQPTILAEAIVGGVHSVLYRRLSEPDAGGARLAELTSPLMSMIVLPYLGRAAARAELSKPAPEARRASAARVANPLAGLDLRLTQRTAGVIVAIAANPGSSNRAVGVAVGVADQGQISKLLMRLQRLGLLVNDNAGNARGGPNAWRLTPTGELVAQSLRIEPGGGEQAGA